MSAEKKDSLMLDWSRFTPEMLSYSRNIEHLKRETLRTITTGKHPFSKNILTIASQDPSRRTRATSMPMKDNKAKKTSFSGTNEDTVTLLTSPRSSDGQAQIRDSRFNPKLGTSYSNSIAGVAPFAAEKRHPPDETEIPIYGELSPEKVQEVYESVCQKFGKSSGEIYLFARSLIVENMKRGPEILFQPEKTAKTMKKPSVVKYLSIYKDCSSLVIDEQARLLMKSPELETPCQDYLAMKTKKWRNVLRKSSTKKRLPSPEVILRGKSSSSEITPPKGCSCGIPSCDCRGKEICLIPKKTARAECELLESPQNYLKHLRRMLKRKRALLSRPTVISTGNRNFSKARQNSPLFSRVFKKQREQLIGLVRDNLTRIHTPAMKEISENIIDDAASAVCTDDMIKNIDWGPWFQNYLRMEDDSDVDDGESVDSNIQSVSTDDSESEAMYFGSTRIPYAEETYNMMNTLFAKIQAKLDRSILKNSVASMRLSKSRFTTVIFEDLLMANTNPKMNSLIAPLMRRQNYLNHFIPHVETKRKKLKRAHQIYKLVKAKKERKRQIDSVQLGERVNDKSTPKRSNVNSKVIQRLIRSRMNELKRSSLAECNIGLSRRVILNDFKILARLLKEISRERQIDPAVVQRLREYKLAVNGGNNGCGEAFPPEGSCFENKDRKLKKSNFNVLEAAPSTGH